MGWMDHQDKGSSSKTKAETFLREMEVCLDGETFLLVNKNCVDKVYTDSMPRLVIVVDEIAELTQKGGLKTVEGKAEDALKDEIISNIQSLTQLGRSSGIHCILCTQRNDASVISGLIQNNPLALDTMVEVKMSFDEVIDFIKKNPVLKVLSV